MVFKLSINRVLPSGSGSFSFQTAQLSPKMNNKTCNGLTSGNEPSEVDNGIVTRMGTSILDTYAYVLQCNNAYCSKSVNSIKSGMLPPRG